MSKEFEGKLISELLSAKSEKKIKELLDEINNINSPSFCYPLYEVYKQNKKEAYSHYILGAMRSINSDEIISIALEIGNESDTSVVDLGYIIKILKDRKFYNPDSVKIGLNYFDQIIKQPIFCHTQDLDVIYTYSVDAGFFEKIESKIQMIYKDNNFELETRIYALNLNIILNPDIRIQELLDNYANLKKDEDLDIIIAKISTKWKGSQVDKLRELIKNTGGIRAKHIIESYEQKKEDEIVKAEKEKEEVIQKTYSNADIIEGIVKIRNEVNSVSKIKSNIKFELLPQNESIVKHLIASNDKPNFIQICSELRSYISEFNNNIKIVDSEYSNEEKSKLLPDNTATSDYNKPINRIFLFLKSREYELNNDVFGLRILNQIANLVTHPKEEDKFKELLKKENILQLYEKEDFVSLHRTLLTKYLDFLQELLRSLKAKKD